VRRPKDKAKAENGVQNVERWVIAPLRKRTFFSLLEVNQAIQKQLDWFNHKPMQAVGRSRREEFDEIDRPNLRPLPEKPYEYAERKTTRVHIDYHVEFDKHLYSVPHILIHQEVEIRATERMVEILSHGKSVAIHPRNFRPGRFSTLREHMPAHHQFIDKVNPEQLVAWATEIGPHTAALVSATLQSRPFPQQAYRSCLGMLSLAKKHNHTVIEQACQAMLETHTFSYTALKDELVWLAQQTGTPSAEPLPVHENIRGNQYYQ
jgi:transposase